MQKRLNVIERSPFVTRRQLCTTFGGRCVLCSFHTGICTLSYCFVLFDTVFYAVLYCVILFLCCFMLFLYCFMLFYAVLQAL